MMLDEAMRELGALGIETVRDLKTRSGAGSNQFGVKSGDLRVLAKKIKTNPDLASSLWDTGNFDAMLLATLLMIPKKLTSDDLDRLVRTASWAQVADWLMTHVVRLHPQKEELRRKWMVSNHMMDARAGWSLTTERVVKDPEGLNLTQLLDRIEGEMGDAPELQQWTMNYCLAEIGINFPQHRERAMAIGEKIGAFRDYPTSKGCTSPFAPIWITKLVRRQG